VTSKFFPSHLQARNYLNIHHVTLERLLNSYNPKVDEKNLPLFYLFDKELNSNEAQDLFLLPVKVKAKSSMIQI
jgi:hypothetical protein